MKKILLSLALTSTLFAFAQVGIGTTFPNGALDVTSTTDGLLIPRVALTSTATATVVTPTTSELVYNTATVNDVVPGFYFWDGANWIPFIQPSLVSAADPWITTGNAGTIAGTNFLGTTDNVALNFRVNNLKAGRIGITADKSTFLGYEAGLNDDLSDNANTFIGYQVGRSNTTGSGNTANGVNAFSLNTTGNYNTANGAAALYSNTTGNYNTANGTFALRSNTTGRNNTANGEDALLNNTTGNNNTANGGSALQDNTTGYDNAANGISALRSNTTGFNNTANGVSALRNNTVGNNNTANGSYALNNNTTGNNNTVNGYESGVSITTGSNNVFIGSNAGNNGSQKVDAQNSIAIGSNSFTIADNQVIIGNNNITETQLNGKIQNDVTTATHAQLTTANTSVIKYTEATNVASGNLPVATDGTFLYIYCTNAVADFLGSVVAINEVVSCVRIDGIWRRVK